MPGVVETMRVRPKFEVLERFLDDSILEKTPLQAKFLVIHSTANPGASDEDHFSWLNRQRRHGWAHYYLDADSISQMVPEGFVAPAQGQTMNRQAISAEICEPPANLPWAEQVRLFALTWEKATWLAADILYRKGWSVDRIRSHLEVSRMYPNETDHTDPIGFFARYGKTWEDFLRDTEAELRAMGEPPTAELWQQELMDEFLATGLINQARHPRQPVEWWELGAVATRLLNRITKGAPS